MDTDVEETPSASENPRKFTTAFSSRFQDTKAYSVFRHRDFRLIWTSAFLSFIGSFIQIVAEGYLVFQLTHRNDSLAWVFACNALPVTVFGPFAGAISDTMDRRKVLIFTQTTFAIGALYLAAATYFGFVQYWQILVVATILGTVNSIDMPTRQAIISKVVPPEDLAAAIPINAMTFNLARLIGPPIGGLLNTAIGPDACYFVNGLSYFALVFAALAVRADLRALKRDAQPIVDLVKEGFLYTMRDRRLRAIFLLESAVSLFGLFYITQMAAIVEQLIMPGRSDNEVKAALAIAYSTVAIGTLTSLFVVTWMSHLPIKRWVLRIAVTLMGVGLLLLSIARQDWMFYAVFALLGLGAIAIFNTCNQLFQALSPDRLRGRVLSMHIWALSGVGPFGTIGFGYLAQQFGLRTAFLVGGVLILLTALGAWLSRKGVGQVDTRYVGADGTVAA